MRLALFVSALSLSLGGNVFGASINFQVQDLGPSGNQSSLYRLIYTVSGFNFQENQELSIRFDAGSYSSLSSALVPSGFSALLLQPNNPPGAAGIYSLLALGNVGAPSGTFSVNVTSQLPVGGQIYEINQLDRTGRIISRIETGETVRLATDTAVPEPSALHFFGIAVLAGGMIGAVRRRRL